VTILFQHPFCPRSRAIRLALAECGHQATPVEEAPWAFRAEFLARNPSGELPVLEFDDGAVIGGLYAIAEFLDDIAPAAVGEQPPPRRLLPGDAAMRAEIRRLIDWFVFKLERDATAELFQTKIFARLEGARSQPPDSATIRAVSQNLRYHLRYLDHLALNRDWLAGEEMSFADLAAAGQISVLDYLGDIDWEPYPSAKSWYMRLKSRPSFRGLLGDRLAGLPPQPAYAELDF
jgi:glutathione S-transferase